MEDTEKTPKIRVPRPPPRPETKYEKEIREAWERKINTMDLQDNNDEKVIQTRKIDKDYANMFIDKLKEAVISRIRIKNENKKEEESSFDIKKEINCIKYSIKKLELNMKLTNQDDIKDPEFINLLTEVSELYVKCKETVKEETVKEENNEKDNEEDNELQTFMEEMVQIRDMNYISYLIKIISFLIPVYIFTCTNLCGLAAPASAAALLVQDGKVQTATIEAAEISAKFFQNIVGSVSTVDLNEAKETVEFIGTAQEATIIDGIYNLVGIGKCKKSTDLKDTINNSIVTSVTKVRNTIIRKATKYQKFILFVFIVLVSINTVLSLHLGHTQDDIGIRYNDTLRIFNNNTSLLTNTQIGSGKKSRQRKQQSPKKSTKPKQTKPKQTKPKQTKPKAAPKKTKKV